MTIAAVVIISALIGGLSGATIVVIYDQSARKRVLELRRAANDAEYRDCNREDI